MFPARSQTKGKMCIWKTTQNTREVKGYSIFLCFYFLIYNSFHFENYPVLFSLYNLLSFAYFSFKCLLYIWLCIIRCSKQLTFFIISLVYLSQQFLLLLISVTYYIGFIFTHCLICTHSSLLWWSLHNLNCCLLGLIHILAHLRDVIHEEENKN